MNSQQSRNPSSVEPMARQRAEATYDKKKKKKEEEEYKKKKENKKKKK